VELIDTEQRARRLARAVATDIVLYNEKQISAGADLSREIAEGRSHFCARVTPSLHWVFEEVLAATPLGKGASEPRVEAPRVEAAQVAAPRVETTPAKPSSRPPPAPASRPDPIAEAARVEAPRVEPEPPRAPSSAPPPQIIAPPPSEPEPRAPSSAPRPEPQELETVPAPPESAPAPQPAPVEPAITQPADVELTRSGAELVVVVLLCALALVLAVSWFALR
jgi:hypothetical protein